MKTIITILTIILLTSCGGDYNTETPDTKLTGSIELCDSVELAHSLSPRCNKKIVKTDKSLNPPNQR